MGTLIDINGRQLSFAQGQTILEVCRENGIFVPTLCYDPRIAPNGRCRLCLVEVAGSAKQVASCVAQAEDGMHVVTESPKLVTMRRKILQHMLQGLQGQDDLSAESSELQALACRYNVTPQPSKAEKEPLPLQPLSPFLLYDPNKCVACARCVGICRDVVMANVISLQGRKVTFRRDADATALQGCESCGQCVSTCPTGALTDRKSAGVASAGMQKVRTTCTYCGTGCSLDLNVVDDAVLRVTSAPVTPVNHGNLCIKGRYAFDFIQHNERLKTPLIREGKGFREASWDEALSFVASRFKGLITQYGPESVGGFSSARCTNEDNYLLAKWVRCAVGSNNIDNCARVCHAPTVAGLSASLGTGAATNSLAQIPTLDTIFLVGANTTESHPIVSLHLKQAIQRGARLIVADPRKTWMARHADVWLNLQPGTDIALLNGIAHIILKNGWQNDAFIAARTDGFEQLREKVAEYTPERVEALTGVAAEAIREAAKLYVDGNRAMIVYGLGVTEHRTGTRNVMALANLALLCGHIGRDGAGIMPLRGQNNVQGACDVGPLPPFLPGYQPVADPAGREKFEQAWNVRLNETPGKTSVGMLQSAAAGTFKGLFIMGEDPAQTDPYLTFVRKALGSLEFLVVQDLFHTETTRYADVVLPGAAFAEKDGTFTNCERRVQRVRRAVPPKAELAEWEALCRLSTLMGYPMHYEHPSEIMDEIASLVPSYGGIRYDRLGDQGLQWPCPEKTHPGTTVLHAETFPRPGGHALFQALEHIGSGELPDQEYPLRLITGRIREHYNNGSMTRRSQGIMDVRGEELVEISPEDAVCLGVAEGDLVAVTSRRGKLSVRAHVTDRSQRGLVFMTFHFADALTNLLTSGHRDATAETPEYKSCAVRVEKV